MKESENDLIQNLQAKQDVAALTQIMQDTTKTHLIRGAASAALYNLGALTIEALIDDLLKEEGYTVSALLRIGKPAVEPLLAALENGGYCAAWPLGAIGDNLAVSPLLVALKNENEKSREAAAWALGQIGDVRAVEPLKTATKDESGIVRKAATEALEKIQSVCGFCDQEFIKATGAPSVKVDLFQMTSRSGPYTHSKYVTDSYLSPGGSERITTTGTVYWEEKSILIPCCKSCQLKRDKQITISLLVSLAIGLIIDILMFNVTKTETGSIDPGFWVLGPAFLLIVLGIGLWIGNARLGGHASKTPVIKALLDSGWKDGPNRYKTM